MADLSNYNFTKREDCSFKNTQQYNKVIEKSSNNDEEQLTARLEESNYTIKIKDKHQRSIRERLVRYGHYDKLQG